MPKITLLGAGSGFTQGLFTDILNIDGLDEGIIGLVDIDAARLAINVRLMRRVLELMNKKNWKIEASTNRKKNNEKHRLPHKHHRGIRRALRTG